MDKQFVGKGWKSKYGISLKLKKSNIEKLETNDYGDIMLEVKERKEPDEKSKATHYVIVDQYAYDRLKSAT